MRKQLIILVIVLMSFVCIVRPLKNRANSQTQESVQNNETEDIRDFVVILNDIDHNQVLQEFNSRYPEEYLLYTTIKDSEAVPEPDSFDSALLDSAIAHKREIYRGYYGEANEAFAQDYSESATCLFISHYSPLVIVRTSFTDIQEIEKDDRVIQITEYHQEGYTGESITQANAFTRANYVRDTCGNKGSGVKIGMIEIHAVPNLSHPYLSQPTITIRSGCNSYDTSSWQDHATAIASIMVGTDLSSTADGFAPNAELYCCRTIGTYDAYNSIEWLLDNNVNVINASTDMGDEGLYGTMCKWVDHIAVQHDVHFVTSAGNIGPNQTNLITAPGLAYNAMTVGAFDPGDATQWNQYNMFALAQYSRFQENDTTYPEKPNLLADGFGFMGQTGTSFAAPQVAGVIAQLCSYNSAYKVKQSMMGAILMASAARKINTSGSRAVGSSFATADRINGEPQISEKEGAGLLDARWARDVAVSGNCWSLTIYDNNFPYSKYVTLAAEPYKTVRVCIFWLRQNSISTTGHPVSNLVVGSMSDLNLEVYDPNGNLIDSSTTEKSNFEIVQFSPMIAGSYEIRIKDYGNNHIGKDYVGLAVWKGNSGQ